MIKRLFKKLSSAESPKYFNDQFPNTQPLKMHIGCGTHYKETWVNIDNNSDNNISKLDVSWDLSLGIPFKDMSVDFIYHEHFIEHLSYDEGLVFMVDCYRVLKPGGVMRIACPDLDALVKDYAEDTWRENDWVKKYDYEWMPSRAYMLNACMSESLWGHKYVYNKEDLVLRLNESGFDAANIKEVTFADSSFEQLRNIDTRDDSMFFEVTR